MANEKQKAGAAAPAKDQTGGAPAGDAPRKRNAISPAKALAIQVAGLVAILLTPKVLATLTEPQKAQVTAAEKAAAELNAQTIQPIKDRIAAIAEEFKALEGKYLEPGTAEKAKELATELNKQQTKLKALTASA